MGSRPVVRSVRRRIPRWAPLVVCAAATAGGCAAVTSQATVEQRPGGAYKLTCRTALPQCLEKAEEICKGNRYVVTRAVDHHDYLGAESTIGETVVRSSEALIVCGQKGRAYWGPAADPMAGAESPPASADAPPAAARAISACVPGATQQCTGPAACRGGQACLPSGGGFSPCDCGAPARDPQAAASPAAQSDRGSGPGQGTPAGSSGAAPAPAPAASPAPSPSAAGGGGPRP